MAKDHPHLRGYYLTPLQKPNQYEGSPPLTRVLQKPDIVTKSPLGITPAYAGTTKIYALILEP